LPADVRKSSAFPLRIFMRSTPTITSANRPRYRLSVGRVMVGGMASVRFDEAVYQMEGMNLGAPASCRQ